MRSIKCYVVLDRSCTYLVGEEEVGEQMANLEKCLEDPDLLERFKRYLDNVMKAA